MTSPQPPQKPNANQPDTQPPKTFLGKMTQVVKKAARVDFNKLALKPDARVPELWVQAGDQSKAQVYPLLGDRYLLGRSSSACDIVVRNDKVSQTHASLSRNSQQPRAPFTIKDEKSKNGIYRGRRRISEVELHHGDIFTLGPPELADAVRVQFVDPPPWYVKAFRWSLYGVGGVTALVGIWIAYEWTKISVRPLPRSVTGPVVVYSRDGQALRQQTQTAHIEKKRLSEFSPYLADAAIASEDGRFNWHLGIDPLGILRAIATNIRGGGIREGGSTITQQLARSLYRDYVGTADSAGRKLREAVVALKLETFYSKDELLLLYLNRVFLGLDLYGFEDAAQFYFGKSATDLTLSEAATLVGILPAPNSFNPIQNYQLAVEYRDRVIDRMRAMGKISSEEATRARRSRIEINPKASEILESTIAPYFYDRVFAELEALLGVGLAREGNFIVETGLNTRLQTLAENTIESGVNTLGVSAGFSQGALVSIDTRDGEILALTGGVDYQDSQFNRATQALRQPGSTFKMFAYAAALEDGFSPGKVYSCAPLTWRGQSFSGCERTSGSATMYQGLAQSENAVALRVAQDSGLDRMVQTARRMGITSDLNPVPGLVLGQSEVTLLEMTGAYGALANQGWFNPAHAVRRIRDSSDCTNPSDVQTCRVIYDYEQESRNSRRAVSPEVAFTMTELLRGVVQNGTGASAYLGLDGAGKTGTTNDGVDLWYIGYLPSRAIATGVWLGNDDNTPTSGSSAQAARVWKDYMGPAAQ
ncbi:transglycosylase domain-containing protein [Oscillatoriales cyanobacterium LEGE 11467]|uniref:Transglycosylase domain-containing protein n=1 Tax=Zarconia navalis LEGE 11467 TaxID=1828826 RepID=A0A928Z9W3_9CYAN|nr:transglycosylase domain-containing protein [Zarconia navalis]MBE9042098.1 transglycosylase domain-containing protein [Zarconia navalis LEGE 11467]